MCAPVPERDLRVARVCLVGGEGVSCGSGGGCRADWPSRMGVVFSQYSSFRECHTPTTGLGHMDMEYQSLESGVVSCRLPMRSSARRALL
eukprot:5210457-Prymnesium_polylepis.1